MNERIFDVWYYERVLLFLRISSSFLTVFACRSIEQRRHCNMIAIQPHQRAAVKGQIFGARRDSCSCDPCDCNPCKCGDSLVPNYPGWRVSGYFVKSGTFNKQQLSEHLLLSLALPEWEGSHDGWQEVLLVEKTASPELVHALLTVFESELESMPAEIGTQSKVKRAIYRAFSGVPDDRQRSPSSCRFRS